MSLLAVDAIDDIERQITTLQQQAEAARAALDDPHVPACWRKRQTPGGWYAYLQIPPAQGELFRRDGWEPLFRRQRAMEESRARLLARQHRGVALVRAVEVEHGIH